MSNIKIFHKFRRHIQDSEANTFSYVDLCSITGFEQYAKGVILIHTTGAHYHVYCTIDKLIELLNQLNE